MKIYLLQDVERVGISGEIIAVKDGYARNFLLPKKLGIEVTGANAKFYTSKAKTVNDRKAAIESKTSLLAAKIEGLKVTIKHKAHDDGKLYGAINAVEIVELLDKEGVKTAKSQIIFDKNIKEKGEYKVTIKLSNKLQPKINLKVVPE